MSRNILQSNSRIDSLRVFFVTLIYIFNSIIDINLFNAIPADYFIMACWIALSPLILVHKGEISLGGRGTLTIILFVFSLMVSTLWSSFPLESFQYSIRLVLLLGFYFLLLNFEDFTYVEQALRNIIHIVFLTSIISLFKFIFSPGLFYGRYLFFITQRGDPNYTAVSLMFCSIYSFYFSRKEGKTNPKYVFLTVYFFILHVLTFSRGVYLAVALTALISFIPTIRRISQRYRHLFLGLAFLLVGSIPFFLLLAWEKVKIFLRFDSIKTGAGRTNLWLNGIRVLAKKPIFGFGAGTFRYLASTDSFLLIPGQVAHNTWLEIAVGGGVIALFLFLSYSFGAIGDLRRCEQFDNRDFRFVRTTLLAFIFILFSALTINLETYRNFWLVAGLAGFLTKETMSKQKILVFRR